MANLKEKQPVVFVFSALTAMVCLLYLNGHVLAQASENPGLVENKPVIQSSHQQLKQARALTEAGEWSRAQKTYRALLEQKHSPPELFKTAQSEFETLNMKILFSTAATEDSFNYTVRPGDNLYDIAKKYGTTVALIKKSNHLSRDTIRPGMKLKVVKAKFSIQVDKSENVLHLYADDRPLKTYRVATGKNNSTPVGKFTIETKLKDPTWYHAGAVVSPDSPDNVLGSRWLGFSLPGYGIHGTVDPDSIGQQVTAGCVRMKNKDVNELFMIIPYQTVVTVKD